MTQCSQPIHVSPSFTGEVPCDQKKRFFCHLVVPRTLHRLCIVECSFRNHAAKGCRFNAQLNSHQTLNAGVRP